MIYITININLSTNLINYKKLLYYVLLHSRLHIKVKVITFFVLVVIA